MASVDEKVRGSCEITACVVLDGGPKRPPLGIDDVSTTRGTQNLENIRSLSGVRLALDAELTLYQI